MPRPQPPPPLPLNDLIGADLWSQRAFRFAGAFRAAPRANLYLQDQVQFVFHPTRLPGLEPERALWATPGGSAGR
jgi:hypothetical protein